MQTDETPTTVAEPGFPRQENKAKDENKPKKRRILQDSWEIFGAPPSEDDYFYPDQLGISHKVAGGTDGHNH